MEKSKIAQILCMAMGIALVGTSVDAAHYTGNYTGSIYVNSGENTMDGANVVVTSYNFGRALIVRGNAKVTLTGTNYLKQVSSLDGGAETLNIGDTIWASPGHIVAETGSKTTLIATNDTAVEMYYNSTALWKGDLYMEKQGNAGSYNSIANFTDGRTEFTDTSTTTIKDTSTGGLTLLNVSHSNKSGNPNNIVILDGKMTIIGMKNNTGMRVAGTILSGKGDIDMTLPGGGTGFNTWSSGAKTNLTGNINIDIAGGGTGIVAASGSQTDIKKLKINMNDAGIGAFAYDANTKLDLYNLTVNAPVALKIGAGAQFNVNKTGGNVVKVTGDLEGVSTGTPGWGHLDVTLDTEDSFVTGAANRNDNQILMTLRNKSVWNMTGDSDITDLNNYSFVNMNASGDNNYETLKTAVLNGGGEFTMDTDLQKSFDNKDVITDSDKIIITEGSAGKHYIVVKDKSMATGNAAEGYLLLVEDKGDMQATFEGKAISTGGVWKYAPNITDVDPDSAEYANVPVGVTVQRNWYLTGFTKDEITPNTETSISLSDTRYDNYFREDDTLLKRLGELRFVKDQPETDGIWVRYRRGGTITDRFDGTFTTMQVGYDKKTSQKRYTGFAISHTTNKHDFAVSSGEGSQTALLLYNTWLGDKEHYFDIVGKVGKMRGESNFYDRNNFAYNENGDYKTWYYGASFEYGRKNRSESGWYYEPQAQLTLGRVNSTDYTTSLGTAVRQDAVNTILLRTGVTVGKEFNLDNPQKRANIYGKINWLYDFKGDVNTSLRDVTGDTYSETNAYGGSSWNAGVGATVNLNRATHFYVDVEKNFGGKVRSNWMAQAGLRWAFGGPKPVAPLPVVPVAPVAVPKHEEFLDTIYFDFDIDTPKAGEQAKIDNFVKVAKENPDRTYSMVGHTDAIGTDEYNMDLSKRRADNVKAIAKNAGVPAAQMEESYQGKAKPADSNDNAEGRANNRRVNIFEYTNK